MSLLLLEGPAGSGKTAGLIGTLASVLQERPLGAQEPVREHQDARLTATIEGTSHCSAGSRISVRVPNRR